MNRYGICDCDYSLQLHNRKLLTSMLNGSRYVFLPKVRSTLLIDFYLFIYLLVHIITEDKNSKSWCKIWFLPGAPDSPGSVWNCHIQCKKKKKLEMTGCCWQLDASPISQTTLLHTVFWVLILDQSGNPWAFSVQLQALIQANSHPGRCP